MWLALRALFWTLLMPGVFGFYLPWRFFGLRDVRIDIANPRQWLGLLCIGVGTILLLTCIWEFARRGKGTLSPADPPRQLVVSGLYRFVRNPMYLSVTLIVFGEVMLTFSRPLLAVLGDLVRDRQPVRGRLRGADARRPVRRRLRSVRSQCRPMDSAAHALAIMISLTFDTVRCQLRPVSPADTGELHRLWTSPGVRRFVWDNEIIPLERAAEGCRPAVNCSSGTGSACGLCG